MQKQRGVGLLDLVLAIAIVTALAYVFILDPRYRATAIDKFRSTPPLATISEHRQIDVYAKKPAPAVVPAGEYVGVMDVGDEKWPTRYFFGANEQLTVEVTVPRKLMRPEITLTGTAPYRFNGSVLVFGDVSGDKALFPEFGRPVEFKSEQEFVVRSVADSVTLRAQAGDRSTMIGKAAGG